MPEISRIQAFSQEQAKKKRVAAYARVSVETDDLLRSLSNQVNAYTELIKSRSDWEFAGVYADSGISGTSTMHRDEFNRMLLDCEEGRINLILTKSISRFARNTLDLLESVRHLKEIGVEVYFEEQRISSMSGEGELMLTLLAAFAQEEAEDIKENVEWGIRKRFEQGIPNGHKRCLGYDWDGEYVIVPEEAETVRSIFNMYLDGKSSVQIARALKENGSTNINGTPVSSDNVRFILDNENYTGNLLLQKRYSPHIGKRAVNRGNRPMYRVEEDHEPIIDQETFQWAQELRKEKAAAMPEKEVTCFSGLLKCGYCGHSVCRRHKNDDMTKIVWLCNTVDKKGAYACRRDRRLPETELIRAAEEVLGENYEETIRDEVKDITVYDDRLVFHLTGGKARVWQRHFISGSHNRSCFTKKIFCGECGSMFVKDSNKKKNYKVWVCRNRPKGCKSRSVHESELRSAVKDIFGKADDLDMKFYRETTKVLVYDDRLDFHMKSGEVISWRRQ